MRTTIEGMNAAVNGIAASLKSGAVLIYDSVTGQDPITEVPLGDPAFRPSAGGRAVVSPVAMGGTVNRDGTLRAFIATNKAGNPILSGTIGKKGADIIVDRVEVKRGDLVNLNGWAITVKPME